jgi:S-adenosylmethionine/arginine decarboxylase-like enzyme
MSLFIPDGLLLEEDPAEMVRDGRAWGMEALLDLYGCNERIDDTAAIARYAGELCNLIGMRPYGDPQVSVFGLADPKTAGPTLVQLLETSSLTAHCARAWDGLAAVNVHSCRPFDPPTVAAFTVEFFGAERWTMRVLARGIRSDK